jgi:hypothetical protein
VKAAAEAKAGPGAMGFSRDLAERALAATHGDVDESVNWLLELAGDQQQQIKFFLAKQVASEAVTFWSPTALQMLSLKSGCIRDMYQGKKVDTPCAVQVLEVQRLSASSAAGSSPAADRFRLVISDGTHSMQAMVPTQMNFRFSNEEIKKDTVIQIQDCICQLIQGRSIVIILKVEILAQPGHAIGSPVRKSAIETMARFQEMCAAANAIGADIEIHLSFNQLKIEIAKRLHIEADDAAFTENRQVLCDAYVAGCVAGCTKVINVPAWINRRQTLADQIYQKRCLKKDEVGDPKPRWIATVRMGSSRYCWHCNERIRGSEKHACSVCK